MKEKQPSKAEKCGVCFFVNNKPIFTLIRTKNKEFNDELIDSTYIQSNLKVK